MSVFGRRTIADLKARNKRLTEQRDFHHGHAERAQGITRRIAAKFTEVHTLGWHEAGRLAEQVDGYQNLLARHARLLKACARYRAENAELHARLHQFVHGGDRAVLPARPIPDEVFQTRREQELYARLVEMQRVMDRVHADELAAARKALAMATVDETPAAAA